jgi:hypothetical protein
MLLLGACHQSPKPNPPLPAGTQVGAASAAGAVAAYMDAVKAEDIQAMSAVWGTSAGLLRDQVSETDLFQRSFIMIKCLRHDNYTVLSEASGQAGKRILAIQITRGPLTRSTNFTVVTGPGNRWYVESFEVPQLDDICKSR